MKRIVVFIVLLPIIIIAQIDSLEYLDYYPLHVGDKWIYEIVQLGAVEGWDTTYQTITVTSDTVMSNGYQYFYLSPNNSYHRVDSISYCVKSYNSSEEIVEFNLYPFEGDKDSVLIIPDSVMIFREKLIGNAGAINGNFEKIGFYYDLGGISMGYEELTKGIGYTKFVIEEARPYLKQLIGAEIDGVIYGNISGIESKNNLPNNYELYPNYPNPFNVNTKIRYEIKNPGYVTIQIFDITGNSIEIIEESRQETGQYLINWNASHYSTGIYIIQMKVGEFIQSRKCLLLK